MSELAQNIEMHLRYICRVCKLNGRVAENCPSNLCKSSAASGRARRKRHQKPEPTVWHRGAVTAFSSEPPLLELPQGGAPFWLRGPAPASRGLSVLDMASPSLQRPLVKVQQHDAAQPPNSKSQSQKVEDALLSWPCIPDATAMRQRLYP